MAVQEGEDSPDRLGEALARLDPQSRRLVQLWLAGLGRREIAAEMRIRDEVVEVIGETAFRHLRLLLDDGSGHGRPADGQTEEGAEEGADEGASSAMTHSRPVPGCPGESPD